MLGKSTTRSPFDGIGAATPERSIPARVILGGRNTPNTLHQQSHTSQLQSEASTHLSSSNTTSHASFFDVVVNSVPFHGIAYDPIESWLGDVVLDQTGTLLTDDEGAGMPKSGSSSSINAIAPAKPQSKMIADVSVADPTRFLARVQELIDTERSYVKRVGVLQQEYASPLRSMAKNRGTAILSIYEAQRLFGNIGEIVGANRAFLNDLEDLLSKGRTSLQEQIGNVLFQHMSCFSCYNEYLANFDKAKHIEQTMSKHKAFRDFTDGVKYSVTGIGNTGLRDLLMEPIQRIPRYKLLMEAISKHLDPNDPQRPRIDQAIMLASRIASFEADEKTKRAAVLWSFSRNIDSFPPELISAHRQFIDCIDVDDFPLDIVTSNGTFAASKISHCTLFLFDDRIAIVKRAHASSCSRRLIGLDDLNQLAMQMKAITEKSSNAAAFVPKKVELAFRGFVNIMDVEGQDLGGTDLQLALSRSPSHVTGEKWTARPIRQYVTVDTATVTSTINYSPSKAVPAAAFDTDLCARLRLDKMRFLENLWRARALYKARDQRSHVRCHIIPASVPKSTSDEYLAAFSEPTPASHTRQIVYYNVYTRPAYLAEPNKSSVVLHADLKSHDPSLGLDTLGPFAMLEIVSLDEHLGNCVAKTRTKRRNKQVMDAELGTIPLIDLSLRLMQLSEDVDRSFGTTAQILAHSNPGTPTGSGFRQRAKATAGLENFGRTLLFGSSTGSNSTISSAGISSVDVFGSPARRSRSIASKSNYSSSTASVSSRAMTFSSVHTSVSSKNSAFAAFTRNNDIGSPRSGARNRRRSSSVGAPAPDQYRYDLAQRHRATTPDPSLSIETVERQYEVAESLLSSPPTSPLADGERHFRAQSVDLARASSSASRRPVGPRRAMSPSIRVDVESISRSSPGPTAALNVRRKVVPISDSEEGDAATPMRSRHAPTVVSEHKTPSLPTKRALPVDLEHVELSFKRPSLDSSRASVDESTATSQQSSAQTLAERPPSRIGSKLGNNVQMPATPARTSSVASKTQESRRRNEAVDQCLRLVKEELKALRVDAETLNALSADRDARTPRKRKAEGAVMKEIDVNGGEQVYHIQERVLKLDSLLLDLDARWISSIRMQNRVMHDFASATPANEIAQPLVEKAPEPTAEVESLRTQVAALRRKCELLTTLEADGRLENTEIHKAFNEELDLMYDNTQKPESEELSILREEVKRVKADQFALSIANKSLHRDLDIQQAQNKVYEEILTKHGLV